MEIRVNEEDHHASLTRELMKEEDQLEKRWVAITSGRE